MLAKAWQEGKYAKRKHTKRNGVITWGHEQPFESVAPLAEEFSGAAGYILLKKVYDMAKTVEPVVRDDVCQEMVVDVLAGQLAFNDITNKIGEYRKRAYKKFMPDWNPSLDHPTSPDGEGLTLGEKIAAPDQE